MAHARPEYAIVLAIIGVCLAVGIPALKRGDQIVGILGIAGAIAVAVWVAITIWRERQ